MRYRLFGRNTGLRVSEMALGTGAFGAPGGGTDPTEKAKKVFATYADAGGRFIDTAEGYQSGRSEELVGQFVGADRDDFVIASKYAVGRSREERYSQKGNSRKAMMTAVEGSLRRLNTDYIDHYSLHAHDAMTPIDEILRGLDDLIRSGKIRYGGLSNFPAWRIARGTAIAENRGYAPITGISIEYSLSERTAERELLPMAEALGIGVTFWSPLGGGFLARADQADGSPPASHLDHWKGTGKPTSKDVAILHVLRAVAKDLDATPARVAHAWLLDRARASTTALVPILGASDPEQVKDVLAATELVLSPDQVSQLEDVSRISLGEPHDHNNFHANLIDGGDHYSPPITVA